MFIYDILVYSKIEQEHKKQLRFMLQRLKGKRLYVKLSKYEFWLNKVAFWGHVISREGIVVYMSKIEVALEWPKPRIVKKVSSFLGLVRYYKKFVEGFIKLARPLTTLMRKKNPFKCIG